MPETKRPLKVFLCHASLDKPKVRDLYRYLRRRGIRPWFDEVDLVGGQDWQVEIPKALSTSDAIIICLTKNSVDKEGYIQKEIKFALDKALEMPEGRIFLIPIRFEECEVPFSLSRYQWVDLFDEAGYARMMRALKFRAAQLERVTVELPKKDTEDEKLALERAAREREEQEAAEKAAREKAERDAVEKTALENAESEAAEKAMREKAKREIAQMANREKAERRAAQIAAIKETLSKSFNRSKLALPKAMPFLRIGGIIGFIFVLFWIGSLAIPQILIFVPTADASVTQHPIATTTASIFSIPFTKTMGPTVTSTSSATSVDTPTSTASFQQHSINWEGTLVSWPGQPISADNAKQLREISNVRVGIGISENHIFFSQDDKLVIYAIGATVFIREVDTGNIVRALYHPHRVWCLSYSPDKNLLVSVNFADNGEELRVWKIPEGTLLLKKFQGYYSCPALSPDGSLLTFLDVKGIRIMQASDLTLAKTISDPNDTSAISNLRNVTFSPDGTLLAGAGSGNIYIWNVKDWTLRLTLQNAEGFFVFSPDGNLLASGVDGKVSIWNVTDGSLVRILEYVSSDWQLSGPLFFIGNGQILVSGLKNYDAIVRRSTMKSFGFWQVSDGVLIRDITLDNEILAGTVSNDDATLIFLSGISDSSRNMRFFAVAP